MQDNVEQPQLSPGPPMGAGGVVDDLMARGMIAQPIKALMQKNTMFKTRKNKGSEFFKSTRIESCSHVKIKGGKAMAVPFIPKKRLTYADRMQKSKETVSLAAYATLYIPVFLLE